MKPNQLIAVTPCEYPDTSLLSSFLKNNNVFPVIHLGNDLEKANETLFTITQRTTRTFGVCLASEITQNIQLPDQVQLVICSDASSIPLFNTKSVYLQVRKAEDSLQAEKYGATGIIVKGNEGAGLVGNESSFVLFQKVKKITKLPIWVQGGVGIHTTPALIMAGARGVVLDSQLALFPECTLPESTKEVFRKIDGTETQVIDGYRVLVRPNSPKSPKKEFSDIKPFLKSQEIDTGFLPLGQDISISKDLVSKYKTIKRFFFALQEAIHGHIRQAKNILPIAPDNAFSKEFKIKYPIAQGPMTRVSDVPEFANAVATSGGLPFIALSLVKGQKAIDMISETKKLAGDKTWGVGILGFASPELREEQMTYIKQAKPPVVLIAGGRPSQAKPLEEIGIKTFLHVPSTGLLDMFIKEGATGFVFEGRECGGHVGPLSSFVLWERQIERLLQEDNLEKFNILFAGGIHDDVSAAMISVMAAPLAIKGAKIGVLMGTSYLFTKEAVETGAILKQFQDQAIKHNDTVLLETAPGHETRCLETPFADFFEKEKEKYVQEGLDKKEIWLKLEQLNVGRLRIASKGIERKKDELIEIDTIEQLSSGMYMIGEVASLRDDVVTIKELHQNVARGNNTIIQKAKLPKYPKTNKKALDIAIVGMSCIFPDAKNIDEYWKNILLGKDCVSEVPDERWNKELYYDPNTTNGEKTPSKWGGFIPDIDFDPMEFGIPPQSLASIEPTQLLSLLVAKRALKDAGYLDSKFDKEDVSVIFGAEGGNDLATNYGFRCLLPQLFGEVPKEMDEALPKLTEDSFPGVLSNVTSGRITNRLDLGGRNYTVDAACASSLAAIDLACQELILEKSNMVLAGGVDLHNGINDYLMFSSTHALSRKGRCKTFDKDADGIALGEGIAVVVLKRLEDAKIDGDKIYAVIKGVGGSSDGKSLGLTAPRRKGQLKALERAYEQAGISPAEIGLIEAHGTGTVVGDKTEISALTDLMHQAGATVNQTHLGSVKTQIGHTKCAAGLAGVIKTALALYHGVKPPTIQLENPNPFYKQNSSPFAFNTKAGLWNSKKRIAGVSAFGFGGTNFHAILEANENQTTSTTVLKSWPSELFIFKGDTYNEASSLLVKIQQLLQENSDIPIKDIAFTLANINQKPTQLSIIAVSGKDLLQKITEVLSGRTPINVYKTDQKSGQVAFIFPGQGSQRVNMARDLFVAFPKMRAQLKEVPELENILFPTEVFDSASKNTQKEAIKDTTKAQPLLGIVDYAIAKQLKKLGIIPDMVAGHSYGELPALCFSNVFEEENLVPLSIQRATSILNAIEKDPGTMIAINVTKEILNPILKNHKDVYLVNLNSPKQLVCAGKTEAISAFADALKSEDISCKIIPVACAFHSPLISDAKENYNKILKEYTFNNPTIPVWSNTTAEIYPTDTAKIKERLTDHLVMPVKFSEQITNMYDQGARIFIEVGPGKVLSSLINATLGRDEVVLSTENKESQGIDYLLQTIAKYMATGRQVDIIKLFEDREVSIVDIEHPEKYTKSKTLWRINGHYAQPIYGKMPAQGAKPITQPIMNLNNRTSIPTPSNPIQGTEELVQEYMASINNIVNAQRDVILGYLGQNVTTSPIITNRATDKTVLLPIEGTKKPIAKPNNINTTVHSKKSLQEILLQIVTNKTGYPEEMLGLDMDMEADLSIDSIKRVEIIGELRTQLDGFSKSDKSEEALIEELTALKTLNSLLIWLEEHALKTPEVVQTQVAETTYKQQNITNTNNTWTKQNIQSLLVNIISEKTGYPEEMLGLDMDMEADLSIDSIKRIEIIGELRAQLGEFSKTDKSEEALVEELTALKTLNSLLQWLEEHAPKAPEVIQAEVVEITNERQNIANANNVWTKQNIQSLLVNIISEKTGYPEEMLGLDMDLEADLSIDSIKRIEIIGELRTQLGGFSKTDKNEEALVEELTALKTLNSLLQWLEEHAPKAPKVIQTEVVEITSERQNIANANNVWTKQNIQSLLVNIISEKTGYPEEMLGLDMDLEADLSIDSIKRIEIIGELRTQLGGFSKTDKNEEALVEELASIKTLNALVNWITDALGADNNDIQDKKDNAPITTATGIPTKKGDTEKLVRWSFQLKTQKKEGLHQNELNQKRFAITDDGGMLSKIVKTQLEKNGAIADIITNNSDELTNYDGLILLDIFSASKRPKIIDFVSLVKKLDAKNVRWIYVISDLNSHLQTSNDIRMLRNLQGYSGFLKSLDKEWPQVTCRTINLETITSLEFAANIIKEELLLSDNQIEVFYKDGKRQIFELIPTTLINNGISPEVKLDKEAVILVLGGAQGITAEMIIRLSREYPCNFVLVGRSLDPRNYKEDQFTYLKSKEEIKKELIALKVFKTPAEIEQETGKIFKRNQILNTIRALELNGATVDYQAIDLRNEEKFSGLIDHLNISYNRIDGVIHGAGLLEDKLFEDKTTDSFERVFSTKVNPIRILAEKLPKDVQFVILFSSVASVYGNKGQTDYAAANSVLDEYARELKQKLKGKVISINWGPWKGAGMVSPTLEREYKKRGIALIPLEEGMETFINEIKYGKDSQVLIMAE